MSGMDEWENEGSQASDEEDDGGFGLGPGMLLGGALAWLFGGVGRRDEDLEFSDEPLEDFPGESELGSLTKEEKVFLSQIWRMEKEIEEAMQEEDWEKVLLLLNVFNGCLNNSWKQFIPGTKDFSPSPKYLADIEGLIGPSLKTMEAAGELSPESKMPPGRIRELHGRSLCIDLDEWKFTFV